MDSLVDDKSAAFRKNRLIALAAPVVILGLFVVYLFLSEFGKNSIIYGIEALVIALAAYYHLKQLIIPDVDYGVTRCLRLYKKSGSPV